MKIGKNSKWEMETFYTFLTIITVLQRENSLSYLCKQLSAQVKQLDLRFNR